MWVRRIATTSIVAMTPVAAGLANAQQPATSERPTYRSLLDQGFEVKSTVFVPTDAGTRIVGATQVDSILITFQKGSVTATCWESFGAFRNQTIGNDPCDVLK